MFSLFLYTLDVTTFFFPIFPFPHQLIDRAWLERRLPREHPSTIHRNASLAPTPPHPPPLPPPSNLMDPGPPHAAPVPVPVPAVTVAVAVAVGCYRSVSRAPTRRCLEAPAFAAAAHTTRRWSGRCCCPDAPLTLLHPVPGLRQQQQGLLHVQLLARHLCTHLPRQARR